MSIPAFLLFLTGLGLLVGGAELLVRGASRLAFAAGISPLVIGLTIVSYGTSAPELAVAVQSAWSSQAQLGLGNVIGSNIFNILFVLGLSASITPVVVSHQLIRTDIPLMLGLSVLVLIMGLDGQIGRVDGIILAAGALVYTWWLLRSGKREGRAGEGTSRKRYAFPLSILFVAVGFALLILGSDWLVAGASILARKFGVSELVIGLTIVAIGTSLPEVATSVLASIRREPDIAVGNVVGSNIFNILFVLGLAAALSPSGIPVPTEVIEFDLPVMIAVAAVCLPVVFAKRKLARWEGILFFAYYLAFTVYLLLEALDHEYLETFSNLMLYAVAPMTIVALFFSNLRALQARTKTTRK